MNQQPKCWDNVVILHEDKDKLLYLSLGPPL